VIIPITAMFTGWIIADESVMSVACTVVDYHKEAKKITMTQQWQRVLYCVVLVAPIFVANSYHLPSSSSRRDVLRTLTGSAAGLGVGTLVGIPQADAVLSSKYCAAGVGDGCADLAEDNQLIRTLQERSATNKEKYARVRTYNLSIYVILQMPYISALLS